MDIKLTKKRLLNVLNYEWIVAILICVAVYVVWSILYTSLATRLTAGQQFFLVTYDNVYSSSNDMSDKFLQGVATHEDGRKRGFSYDVYEITHNHIIGVGSYSASYMLDLRLSVDEGDVIIMGGGNVEYNEEDDNTYTDILRLVSSGRLSSFSSLLKGAYDYTVGNGFITETDSGYTVNAEKIEIFFKTERIKSSRNYRLTYNTDKKIADGVKKEIERIEIIYNNYLSISKAIEKAKALGSDFLWYATPVHSLDGVTTYGNREAFGIDLNALSNGEIKNLWFTKDESGNSTSEGLVMAVFDMKSVQSDLQYESLAVIDYIIREYSDYAD